MPWHCTVCARTDLRDIHDALIRGEARRAVARRFGIHHSTLDRHWWTCVPEMAEAAAQAADAGGTDGLDVLDGRQLLLAMQATMQAAVRLFERLQSELEDETKAVDRRAVVASLREVRASIESTAKLSFAVQDRPSPPEETARGEIDEAIMRALAARDIDVSAPAAQPDVVVDRGLALPAAPST